MALEDTIPTSVATGVAASQTLGDTTMADTVIAQPQDGLMGGGTLGGLILGSLLSGRGLLGGAAAGTEVAGNNAILQAMNQQQLASATQILTQDVNRAGHDVATSAADTQAAIASSTLQSTISSLQGQTALTSTMLNATAQNAAGHTNILTQGFANTADVVAGINNARVGIGADIQNALGVLDSDIHGVANQIDRSFNSVRDEIGRSTTALMGAAHSAEINQLKSASDIKATVLEDGDKTRNLINNNTIMDLQRQLGEARNDHRHDRTTSDLVINNNNNNNLLAQQMQQQAQQQQIATVASGLSTVLAHLNNIQQISIATGRNNTITPNAVNV